MPTTHTQSLTRAEWDAAAGRSIFFGHQSVGENMLDGLRRISEAKQWPALRVVELTGQETIEGPMLAHTKIGQNGDPKSKTRAFGQAIDAGIGRRVDIALMKYCFWDIRRETDVEAVFSDYRMTMDDLARRYPAVTFVHATVPLVAADVDWRARMRRLLGMSTSTDADNAARETLNRKIREAYGSSEVVLDIAKTEAETGRPSDPPQLAEELSSDGAHLNDVGRQRVGAELVKALSAASSRARAQR